VPSSAIAQNSGIWIRKNKKRKQLRLQKKPEVTIKPYDKVITKDAISDDGFMVHRVDKKYYFEILISGQGHALVSRLSKLPSNLWWICQCWFRNK
jgi:hypothetical protein